MIIDAKSQIMRRIHREIRYTPKALSIIEKHLDEIIKRHDDILEIDCVFKEKSLLFIVVDEMDPRSDMYCPHRITTRFVIDTKNNKWGTYEKKENKVYSWHK